MEYIKLIKLFFTNINLYKSVRPQSEHSHIYDAILHTLDLKHTTDNQLSIVAFYHLLTQSPIDEQDKILDFYQLALNYIIDSHTNKCLKISYSPVNLNIKLDFTNSKITEVIYSSHPHRGYAYMQDGVSHTVQCHSTKSYILDGNYANCSVSISSTITTPQKQISKLYSAKLICSTYGNASILNKDIPTELYFYTTSGSMPLMDKYKPFRGKCPKLSFTSKSGYANVDKISYVLSKYRCDDITINLHGYNPNRKHNFQSKFRTNFNIVM